MWSEGREREAKAEQQQSDVGKGAVVVLVHRSQLSSEWREPRAIVCCLFDFYVLPVVDSDQVATPLTTLPTDDTLQR